MAGKLRPNGSSIQSTLEAALTQRLRKPVFVVGSGRTDAGVHASQQFAHFDLEEPIVLSETLIYSINCILPGRHCDSNDLPSTPK
jgi:tRNA pseudouridine38-40 synthase